jgi:hypothetical protein
MSLRSRVRDLEEVFTKLDAQMPTLVADCRRIEAAVLGTGYYFRSGGLVHKVSDLEIALRAHTVKQCPTCVGKGQIPREQKVK